MFQKVKHIHHQVMQTGRSKFKSQKLYNKEGGRQWTSASELLCQNSDPGLHQEEQG